jgi:hypothetical protein
LLVAIPTAVIEDRHVISNGWDETLPAYQRSHDQSDRSASQASARWRDLEELARKAELLSQALRDGVLVEAV